MEDVEVVGARLAKLRTQWRAFTARVPARMLLWQAEADELALVTAFFDVEANADVAETPDLFLHLTNPFADGRTHGFGLLEELAAQYAEAREEVAAEEPAWVPHTHDERDDVCSLLHALGAFFMQHGDVQSGGRLGVWLDPSAVHDWLAYLQWLRRLVRSAPQGLRFIAVDADPALPYRPLAACERERVEAVGCALDVPRMLEELVAGHGEATPADRYRLLIVRLMNPSAGLDVARALGAEATQIGIELGQLGLAAGAQMMLAGACCRHSATDEALLHFSQAERLGERQKHVDEALDAASQGSPTGAKIQLTAKLGGAAVMLSVSQYDAAARSYLEGTQQARAMQDHATELDCHRLASLCFALGGACELGWEVGLRGLGRGLGLDDEVRRTQPFLQLAAHVLRLTRDYRALRRYEDPLVTQLERAIGPSWHEQLERAA